MKQLRQNKIKVVMIMFLFLFVVALFVYQKLTAVPDCFVAEQPYKLSSKQVNNITYSIYVVISGFHEKSQNFYLLEEPVTFDDCGYFDKVPIFSASPEFEQKEQYIRTIQLRGIERFSFEYLDGDSAPLEDIQVNWSSEKLSLPQ